MSWSRRPARPSAHFGRGQDRSRGRGARTAGIAAAVLAVGAAVAALTGLGSASAAPTPEAARTVQAAQVRADRTAPVQWIAVKTADTEPKKPKLGASWVTYLQLHQDKGGKPGKAIGDGSAKCSVVDVTSKGPITQCQRVLRADGGSLALSGMIDRFGKGPYAGDSAIVGGTGLYAGASGEARITLDGKLVRLTLDLDR